MSIPDFQTIMLPLLQYAGDCEIHHIHEAVARLAENFDLSEEEQSRLLPSGQQPVFYNRVGWARTYLKKAGLIEDPERGYFKITERGLKVIADSPTRINMKFLEQYEEYRNFREPLQEGIREKDVGDTSNLEELTPEEAFEETYQRIQKDLASDLLEYILKSSPGFFEKLVIELLLKMGYGGTQRDAARAVGQSGDEGIDGIIDEDRLGLDTIYIQAKKWDPSHSVGRPDIQKFVGALSGKRSRKGIFITTSRFTNDARDYAERIDTKVVLIDGNKLTRLMLDHNVGVSTTTIYEMKEINTDYFGEIPNN